jgi:hypothetical protein
MEGLQPGSFTYRYPTLMVRVYPLRKITMHLSKDGIRWPVRMKPTPLLWPCSVPDLRWQRVSLGPRLQERNQIFASLLNFLGVVVVQAQSVTSEPLLILSRVPAAINVEA